MITVCSFGGNDSRGASAVPVSVSVQLCNCSGTDRGQCVWHHQQDGFSNNDTFVIVACACRLPLYNGMMFTYKMPSMNVTIALVTLLD